MSAGSLVQTCVDAIATMSELDGIEGAPVRSSQRCNPTPPETLEGNARVGARGYWSARGPGHADLSQSFRRAVGDRTLNVASLRRGGPTEVDSERFGRCCWGRPGTACTQATADTSLRPSTIGTIRAPRPGVKPGCWW